MTSVPLSQKGNFNDIAHQPYIGVFRVFGDPKQPVKTMVWTMGRQSGQSRRGIQSLGQPCKKKTDRRKAWGRPANHLLNSKVTQPLHITNRAGLGVHEWCLALENPIYRYLY